jgi:predicted phage terminase large subunit-like protein
MLSDEDIAALLGDPDVMAVLAALQDPQQALVDFDRAIVEKEGLFGFIRLAWAAVEREGTYRSNWHIGAICELLTAVSMGQVHRAGIAVPPRHMKSLSCAVMWPAWDWIDNPWRRFLFSSYAHNLSVRDSVKCRRILKSPWFQARWGDRMQLTDDQNTKIRFENQQGGVRLCTSVKGQLTGEGGDIVVVDDPHNVRKAESPTDRESTLEWWSESMSTRLNDPANGAFVIIQQRVHERDLLGYVIEKEGLIEHGGLWHYLCLPAKFEHDHPHVWVRDPRKEEGQLLWPAHVPLQTLNALEIALGAYAAAGQLQQRPAPRDGGMFKRHWFKPTRVLPTDMQWLGSWDLAATEEKVVKSDPDYTARVMIGFSPSRAKWIIGHVDQFRANPSEVYERMRAAAVMDTIRFGRHKIIYPQDPGQAGKDQAHAIAKLMTGFSFECRPVTGDKVVRATPLSSQAEMGNIEVYYDPDPKADNDWQKRFIDEMCGFPTGAHDDQVDAAASGFNTLTGGQEGLLEYYQKKLAANKARDAAAAAIDPKAPFVAPARVEPVTTETTVNLARAYLGRHKRP